MIFTYDTSSHTCTNKIDHWTGHKRTDGHTLLRKSQVVWSVQRRWDFSVSVERFGTDGLWDSVLRRLMILVKSSTRRTRQTGCTTVSVSALGGVDQSHVGNPLVIRRCRGNLCEWAAFGWRVDVPATSWLWTKCSGKEVNGGCGRDRGTGPGGVESKHLVRTSAIDDKIERRHEPFTRWSAEYDREKKSISKSS